MREDLELLRDGAFARLLTARTISEFGGAFAPVALAFGVLHLPGATPKTLSIVLACESIPMVVFLLVGGVIADRLPRQRVMMGGEILGTVAFAGLAVLLGSGFAPVWLMGIFAAASGVGIAVLWPALTGVIPEVVPAEQLQAGNALLSMGANVSHLTGVVASGLVVAWASATWALAFAAMMFATSGFLIAGLKTTPTSASDAAASNSVLRDLRDGWAEFTKHQWLWVVVLQYALLVCVFSAAHGVFGPVIANNELGGAKAWSWILAGESVGMIVGVVVAMRVRPRRPILAAVLANIPTIPLPWLLLGLHAPLPWVIVGSFVMGLSFDFFGILWNTTMQREVPAEALSRVSSYDALGSLMFGPLGLLLAGPIAATMDIHHALVGCSALLLLVGIAGLASPSVRQLEWHDAPPDAATSLPLLPEQVV